MIIVFKDRLIFVLLIFHFGIGFLDAQTEPNKAIYSYVSQFFADLNNLGDVSLSVNDRQLFIPEINNKYFNPRNGETIIDNHITDEGSKEISGSEYLYLVMTSFEEGVQFSFSGLKMLSLLPDPMGFEIQLNMNVNVLEGNNEEKQFNQNWVLEAYILTVDRIDARIKSIIINRDDSNLVKKETDPESTTNEVSFEDELWSKAELSKNEDDLKEYVDSFPEGNFRDTADSLLQDIETRFWQKCMVDNSLESFNDYLSKYPNGLFKDEAYEAIEQLNMEQLAKGKEEIVKEPLYQVESIDFQLSVVDSSSFNLGEEEINTLRKSLIEEEAIEPDKQVEPLKSNVDSIYRETYHVIAPDSRPLTYPCKYTDGDKNRWDCSMNSLFEYLNANLIYPDSAVSNNIEGRVAVFFFIDEEGNTSKTYALKDIGYGCGSALLDVIDNFNLEQAWEPAYLRQKPVPYRVIVPYDFSLESEKAKKAKRKLDSVDIYKLTGVSLDLDIHHIDSALVSEMIYVEGGKFDMGCLGIYHDSKCEDDELPVHEVTLDDFHISKLEVSNLIWYNITGREPVALESCPNCAVNGVSYAEALLFVKKLNEITSREYSIPTEAQWEYAARGGVNKDNYLYSGSDDLSFVANKSRKLERGTKFPNSLGIYDMTGNVAEWCLDKYSSSFYSSSGLNNPVCMEGDYCVYRGGSVYDNLRRYGRVSDRQFTNPHQGFLRNGFRLTLSTESLTPEETARFKEMQKDSRHNLLEEGKVYLVNAGRFTILENAKVMEGQLKDLGYTKAKVIKWDNGYYYLISGSFTSIAKAQEVSKKMREDHDIPNYIMEVDQ